MAFVKPAGIHCLRFSIFSVRRRSKIADKATPNIWNLADAKGASDLGFSIGRKVNNSRKGILASWVSQANTLGDAFDIFSQNIPLLNPTESWLINNLGDQIELIFTFDTDHSYPAKAVHRSMMAILAWGRELSGQAFNVDRFEVRDDCKVPKWLDEWSDDIQTNASQNRILVQASVLDLPLLNSNEYLANIIQPRAEEVLKQLNMLNFSQKVKYYLNQDLKRYCDCNEICRELNLSRSTLYRRLKEEGVSFSQILSQVRQQQYVRLRNSGLKILAIALELGFQDASSFYKSSQGWGDEFSVD